MGLKWLGPGHRAGCCYHSHLTCSNRQTQQFCITRAWTLAFQLCCLVVMETDLFQPLLAGRTIRLTIKVHSRGQLNKVLLALLDIESPALNGFLPFLPHHHTRRWEELVLIFLASMETRIMVSHFAETASCGHPGPSPRCPPITHRSSRSRYAMAKGDRDLMPSTGSMIPSHTVESRVRKSQVHARGHQR